MRILIVEDNRNLARGLRHNLELEGYDVEVAYDGTTGPVSYTHLTLPTIYSV